MTFVMVLIVKLCILLMFVTLGLAQEESIEAEDNSTSIYTTCDFDLENIEIILQYLPAICSEIYYNRSMDTNLYDLYMEESQSFGKFYRKLDDYELRSNGANNGEEVLLEYPFETNLRNESYAKVDWAQCIITANSSAADYLNCVTVKRLELLELIPNVSANKME